VHRLSILDLVNETKLEHHLHSLFHIVIVVITAKVQRDEVSTSRVVTIRIEPDLPLMASYHERPRSDYLFVGHLLYDMRVVFHHKQVVPAVRVDVDSRCGAVLSVGDD
jgi:hypothetical protein